MVNAIIAGVIEALTPTAVATNLDALTKELQALDRKLFEDSVQTAL